ISGNGRQMPMRARRVGMSSRAAHGFVRRPTASAIAPVRASRRKWTSPPPISASEPSSSRRRLPKGHGFVLLLAPQRTIQREQIAVKLRPPVADHAPGDALFAVLFGVECCSENFFPVLAGLRHLCAARIGDEGRTIKGEGAASSFLAADPI